MELTLAPDVDILVAKIQSQLKMPHIKPKQICCFRSYGSRSRARARIWGFPKIWQMALKQSPHYCIEVLSEKFDRLSDKDKHRIIIHELLHIPKNFSGALLPHRGRGKLVINLRTVNLLFNQLKRSL